MLGQLRSAVKSFCLLLARPLAVVFTPNQVTLLAIPFALGALYFVIQREWHLALVFALLSGLMDLLDGSVAQIRNQKSPFGNYLDAMVDKIQEVILYAGFAVFYPIPTFLAVSSSLLVSYAKPRAALVIEMDNHDWPAAGERVDRMLVLGVGLLAAPFLPVLLLDQFWNSLLVGISVMCLIGLIQRMLYARKLIHDGEKNGKLLTYLQHHAHSKKGAANKPTPKTNMRSTRSPAAGQS